MKKNFLVAVASVVAFLAAVVLIGCKATDEEKEVEEQMKEEVVEKIDLLPEQNEPIVTNIFTADPSAHVFDGKIYIYPSHDPDEQSDPNASSDDGGDYQMVDYHVLSFDNETGECIDNGIAFSLEDIPWASAQLWAPDAAYKDGTYYFYFPAKDKDGLFRIGVAISDSPTGPFTPEPNYIEGSFSIDPAVFIDDDGTAYMLFGGIWGGQLEHWQTGEYVDDPDIPEYAQSALGPMIATMTDNMLGFADEPREISILDEDGHTIYAGNEVKRFFEAVWLHKYNGKYYLSYSTGTTHYLVYAVSDNIEGPYIYQGRILEPVLGWTTHHSIVEYGGKWYLFYHDASLSNGVDYKRSVKFVEIEYDEDGKIKTITP